MLLYFTFPLYTFHFIFLLYCTDGLPDGASGKEPTNAGDPRDARLISGSRRPPGGEAWQATPSIPV